MEDRSQRSDVRSQRSTGGSLCPEDLDESSTSLRLLGVVDRRVVDKSLTFEQGLSLCEKDHRSWKTLTKLLKSSYVSIIFRSEIFVFERWMANQAYLQRAPKETLWLCTMSYEPHCE